MAGGFSDFLQGAGGGALAGGGLGLGPWGALGGGVLGGLAGLLGGGENGNDAQTRQMLNDYYNQINGRQAPQAGPAAQGSYSDFRNNQSQLIDRLTALSNGQGPSLAMQQYQQATDKNLATQQAMAASGRGGPLAAFTAANNMSSLGAQAAQGSAIARTGEEMGALGQLGGVINQGRSSDESMNQFNAQQQNYMTEANLRARLQTMGMNDEAIEKTIGMLQGQNAQQYGHPSLGQQILAGGSGLFAFGASQRGQQNAGYGNGNGSGGQWGVGSQGNPWQSPNQGYSPGANGMPITSPGQV